MASLFDFSFSDFIIPKIIKVLYLLGHIFSGLIALALLVIGFGSESIFLLFFALIFSPIVYLLLVVLGRISLETMIVVFRIGEHVRDIAQQKRS